MASDFHATEVQLFSPKHSTECCCHWAYYGINYVKALADASVAVLIYAEVHFLPGLFIHCFAYVLVEGQSLIPSSDSDTS